MCFGAQDHPLVTCGNAQSVLNIWLTGTFNGHQIGQKCHSHESDVRHLLWGLHQRQAKRFPTDDLVGHQSIGAVINYHLAHL